MKTKTLFLTLFAGAFLCFSNASYAQYHTSGNSYSSSGSANSGVGDGPFAEGDKFVGIGVGFVGSGLSDAQGPGYSTSTGPAIEINSEKAVSDHIGIGFAFSYQGASATNTFTTQDVVLNQQTFQYEIENFTTTDKYTFTLLQLNIRGAYHFSAGDKLDPYAGIGLGYCDILESLDETTNDPNGGAGGSSTFGAAGIEYGAFAGARYFFSDHVGAWFELQYFRSTFSIDGYSASITSSNFLNLGIMFKF